MPRPPIVICEPIRARAVRGPRDDGRWYWRAEVYASGKAISLGTRWATREEAIEWARGLSPERHEPDEIRTISDLVDGWYSTAITDREDIRPRTRAVYRVSRNAWQRHPAGAMLLDRLTSSDMPRIRDQLLRTYAPLTVVGLLQALRTAARWAYSEGFLAREIPAVVDVRDPRPKRAKHTPSASDVARVVDRLEGWPRLLLILLWSTGARVGEIAALRPCDVDLDAGILRVSGKTGPREIPISEALAAELEAWTGATEYLLGVVPTTIAAGNASRMWTRAAEEAGVRRWTAHGLRRLAVDQLARSGVDVATAASLLGHSPEVMLRHYRQVTPDDRRKALAVARLGEAPAGQELAFKRRKGL